MKLFSLFVLLTLYFVYCRCEEKLEDQTNGKEEERKGKQLIDKVEHGGWRTVSPQEWRGLEEWIPRDEHAAIRSEYLDNLSRRRRIRKRKRRPPSEERAELPERQLPSHTLEDVDETWMEIDEETVKVPHSRRRVVPVYLSDLDEHDGRTQSYEKVRDPFTALEEAEAKSRLKKRPENVETTTVTNLKTILKQSGGTLNLSELLQRKNLTLTDLLNGKQQAISALTEKAEISTEPAKKATKRPNYPMQSTSRHFELSSESEEEQKDKVTTTPTTDRKVFIPTYPKIIPFHYKHSTIKASSTGGPITISASTKNGTRIKINDYRSKYDSLRPKLQNSLPMTNAKLNKSKDSDGNKTAPVPTTPFPEQAFTINLQELFGFSEIPKTEGKLTDDTPLHMKIDFEASTDSTKSKYTTPYFEKLKPSSARDEIMEVLRDQRSRHNLSRILSMRNMTLQELVEQRERGSSQVHLADIFHNQTREPEPPSEPFVGIITEHAGRKAKTLPDPINNDSKPLEQKKPSYTVTSFPTYKIARDTLLHENQSVPFQMSVLKTLYPNLYAENLSKESEGKIVNEGKGSVNEILHNDVHMSEHVENTISDAVNHKFNVEINENNSYEDENTFTRLPNGVKSAIIASAALVGLSLLVFLTILIICKWSNKKKKRLCYSDVYSGSRIKSPILETRPKRTIRTIMHETLGRNKNYSNVYPQNISDYFWESDKKPFQ